MAAFVLRFKARRRHAGMASEPCGDRSLSELEMLDCSKRNMCPKRHLPTSIAVMHRDREYPGQIEWQWHGDGTHGSGSRSFGTSAISAKQISEAMPSNQVRSRIFTVPGITPVLDNRQFQYLAF